MGPLPVAWAQRSGCQPEPPYSVCLDPAASISPSTQVEPSAVSSIGQSVLRVSEKGEVQAGGQADPPLLLHRRDELDGAPVALQVLDAGHSRRERRHSGERRSGEGENGEPSDGADP